LAISDVNTLKSGYPQLQIFLFLGRYGNLDIKLPFYQTVIKNIEILKVGFYNTK